MKVAREDLMDTSQYRESAGKCLLSTHDQNFFFFFFFFPWMPTIMLMIILAL